MFTGRNVTLSESIWPHNKTAWAREPSDSDNWDCFGDGAPLGFQGGQDPNLYRYVGNSPTNATDPTGMLTKSLSGAAGARSWISSFTSGLGSVVNTASSAISGAVGSAVSGLGSIVSPSVPAGYSYAMPASSHEFVTVGDPRREEAFALGWQGAAAREQYEQAASRLGALQDYAANRMESDVGLAAITGHPMDMRDVRYAMNQVIGGAQSTAAHHAAQYRALASTFSQSGFDNLTFDVGYSVGLSTEPRPAQGFDQLAQQSILMRAGRSIGVPPTNVSGPEFVGAGAGVALLKGGASAAAAYAAEEIASEYATAVTGVPLSVPRRSTKGPAGFSNPTLGNQVHDNFGRRLTEQTGTMPSDWLMRTKPGQRGVDAEFIGAGAPPGFKFAELKPYTENGFDTFEKQLDRWNLPTGQTQLWFYNKQGVVGSSGLNY